ncbi:hypothetical protein GCM10009756_05500 [Pseudokineococcus marinus]
MTTAPRCTGGTFGWFMARSGRGGARERAAGVWGDDRRDSPGGRADGATTRAGEGTIDRNPPKGVRGDGG